MASPVTRAAQRAQNAYRRIQDKPTQIVFRTPAGTRLAVQTLRVEVDNRATIATSTSGAGAAMGVIVYGWRDHPTYADSDIAEGYTFVLQGDIYRIEDVILTFGEIQGTGVRTG